MIAACGKRINGISSQKNNGDFFHNQQTVMAAKIYRRGWCKGCSHFEMIKTCDIKKPTCSNKNIIRAICINSVVTAKIRRELECSRK